MYVWVELARDELAGDMCVWVELAEDMLGGGASPTACVAGEQCWCDERHKTGGWGRAREQLLHQHSRYIGTVYTWARGRVVTCQNTSNLRWETPITCRNTELKL